MKTATKQDSSASRASTNSHTTQRNKYAHCEFTLHISRDEEWSTVDFDATQPYAITYGFETVTFWNPKTQRTETPDPTKFRVSAETFELARSEFWIRYTNYCIKRWGYRAKATSTYQPDQNHNPIRSTGNIS